MVVPADCNYSISSVTTRLLMLRHGGGSAWRRGGTTRAVTAAILITRFVVEAIFSRRVNEIDLFDLTQRQQDERQQR